MYFMGDSIYFRANGNKEYNNDRVMWCPAIEYQEDEAVAMISDVTMTGSGSLEFTVESGESLSGDITGRVSLSAIVSGKKEQEVIVDSAQVKDGAVQVAFEAVAAEDTDQIQLLVGFDEDHRFVTYSPQDFGADPGKTYSLTKDFSTATPQAGPVWYYKYEDSDGNIVELPYCDTTSSYAPRWMLDKNGSGSLRIFNNGMMPGDSDVILEWRAPETGLIQITEDDRKIHMEERIT